MSFVKFVLLAVFIGGIHAEFMKEFSSGHSQPDGVIGGIGARRNNAVANGYNMPVARVQAGISVLQTLLDKNANNEEVIKGMMAHFRQYSEYDWHVAITRGSTGDNPVQYVYYMFDRGNTELLIAAYKHC